jgi:hypothetical protein
MFQKHKVFVSFHHANDQEYRDKFEKSFSGIHDVMVSRSVQDGDIDPQGKTEAIRAKIRDEYLRDSTVTVVLVGAETWKRKHVDWEIGSSIRQTEYNSRSGLIGIMLPTHPDYDRFCRYKEYNENIIPPRLYYNVKCGFACLYAWGGTAERVQGWIHDAFLRRTKIVPDNSYPSFAKNRSADAWGP